MSYTKHTLEHFSESINAIFRNTIDDNDLSIILQDLNSLIEIGEKFSLKDSNLEFYWNEIIADAISIINCGLSGQYRIAISGLRNILELACSAFFYLDHKIELSLYVNENFKSETYVSSIIHNFHFFKTIYIKTFYPDILSLQSSTDSVSCYLNLTYGKLSDVVHGRYKSLTKGNNLSVEYSKAEFKKFETMYFYTLSAIATLYILRFNDFENTEIVELAKKSKTLNIN